MERQIGNRLPVLRGKDIPDIVWGVCLFLLMLAVICFGGSDAGANYYYYFTFFLFFGYSLLLYFFRNREALRLYLPVHFAWYGIFILLAVASGIWADSLEYSFVPLSKMVQILATTYCLILYIDSEETMERYIRAVIAATLFMIVFIFVRTPSAEWFSGFLGIVTRYNTNDVGCALSIGVIFAFYEAYVRGRKLYYAVVAVAFFTAILTSSRKALFMCVLGILIMVVFNYRARNYMLRVLIALAGLALAVLLIYQIPYLYQTVGVRIDKMIEFVMTDRASNRNTDSSLALRSYYIDMAKSYFEESPLFGIGMNNFTYRIHDYGVRLSYAHNNYMEIAADLGIIGLIMYYWFYIYLLLKLAKHVLNGKKNALPYFAMMILLLIFEYGMVNYYKMQVHLVIAVGYAVSVMHDRADRFGGQTE